MNLSCSCAWGVVYTKLVGKLGVPSIDTPAEGSPLTVYQQARRQTPWLAMVCQCPVQRAVGWCGTHHQMHVGWVLAASSAPHDTHRQWRLVAECDRGDGITQTGLKVVPLGRIHNTAGQQLESADSRECALTD